MVIATLISGGCGSGGAAEQAAGPLTIIIVRHAEKAVSKDSDPPLSKAGLARSRRLATMLRKSGVTALYASDRLRTRQTLEPLAESLSLEIKTVPATEIDTLVTQLRRERGVAVVAAHTDTIEPIIGGLGGPAIDSVPESDYDDMFVVTVSAGRASMLRLSY